MLGTEGNDRIRGSRSQDVIITLGGDDRVSGLRHGDFACMGSGDDTVTDVRSWSVGINLSDGDDRVRARDAGRIWAGDGDDTLRVGGSAGTIGLGPGSDVLVVHHPLQKAWAGNTPCVDFRSATGPVRVDLGTGRATGQGQDRLVDVRCAWLTRFDDVFTGSALAEEITAMAGFDVIRTGAGNDTVSGGANADRIYLGDGDDGAVGGAGWDRIYGEAGNDDIEGWANGDYLDGGSGDDQVFAAFFCEISGNSYGNGGLLDHDGNEVFGGPGDDYLTGDRGNDRIDGGAGFDSGQGGYRDGRADWITSLEVVLDGCLPHGRM